MSFSLRTSNSLTSMNSSRQSAVARKSCSALFYLSLFVISLLTFNKTAVAAPPEVTLIVASNLAPKMYTKEDGTPTGSLTELATEIVKRAGYTPVVKALPWARAVQAAQDGEGVIAGFSKNPEREKIFSFSDVMWVDNIQIITVKKANLNIQGPAGLKGKRVGLQLGSSFGPAFEEVLPQIEADRDTAIDVRLKKLDAGRIDAAIVTGGMVGLNYNAKLAGVEMSNLQVQTPPLLADPNFLAVSNTRPDRSVILEKLNAAISAMDADGSAKKILAAWE